MRANYKVITEGKGHTIIVCNFHFFNEVVNYIFNDKKKINHSIGAWTLKKLKK